MLFLTNCKEREIKQFEFIYEWFDEILNIILPHSKPLSLTIESNIDFKIFFKHILIDLDLGIKEIYFKPINFEKEIPEKIQKQIRKNFPYGENKVCFVATEEYLIIKEDNLGQLQASNSKLFINKESQLIATTHEIFLLDIKKLFRKDVVGLLKNIKIENLRFIH